MKAKEIQTHLRTLNGGWVDEAKTVDTFKAGDPEALVRGIAVGWMGYTWALQQAVSLGCNIFITHEPTYYDHCDSNEKIFELPRVSERRRFIEENQLVILRCHDLWDQYPVSGIPDAWADALGLGAAIGGEGYFRLYDVSGNTALDIARNIARKTRDLGQEAVQLIGPADKAVNRLALGTGAITPFFYFVQSLGADIGLCTDDGLAYWREAAYAVDADIPLIIVNHTVSELAGIRELAQHLQAQFPQVPVHYIPQRCVYNLVFA